MHHLDIEKANYQTIRQRLLETYTDLDEETLEDTLEGITGLHDMLAATLRSALDDESAIQAIKDRVEKMRCRADRLKTRALKKRQACLAIMQECRIAKLTAEDLTASVRKGRERVEIFDTSALPERFLILQPPLPDRRDLLKALQANETVNGAKLVLGDPSLSVRV